MTDNKDGKAREFWIYFQHGNHCIALEKVGAARNSIHVIEMSAYHALEAERDLLQLEVARLVGEKSAIAGKHMKDLPEYNELLAQATAMAEALEACPDWLREGAKGHSWNGNFYTAWSKFLSERGGER